MATTSVAQPSGVHRHCVASRDIEQVLTDLDNTISRVAKPQDRPLAQRQLEEIRRKPPKKYLQESIKVSSRATIANIDAGSDEYVDLEL